MAYGDASRGQGRGDGVERELHPATCSSCGKDTEVPFRPTEGRPVYCQDCFQNQRGGGGGARRGGGGGGGGGNRPMHDATCAKCGVETQVPFRPTEGRPVYCRDCFQPDRGR